MKVLKFGAVWCKDCLVMKPRWQEIEAEMPELATEYYDAAATPEMLEKWQLSQTPLFVFVAQPGHEIIRLQGIQGKDELLARIKEYWDK